MKKIIITTLSVIALGTALYAQLPQKAVQFVPQKCSQCNGTGWWGNMKCPRCGGDGDIAN